MREFTTYAPAPLAHDLKELLPVAAATKTLPLQYLDVLSEQHGSYFALKVDGLFQDRDVQTSLKELWIVTFLQALFAGPALSLELSTRAIDDFKIPSTLDCMIALSARLIPAYSSIEAPDGDGWIRFSAAVQSGAHVLLPFVLAWEGISDRHDRLLVAIPGSLDMDGVKVDGFYLDHDVHLPLITDIRDTAPPADASASATLEYHFTEAEHGYWFRIHAAGYPLRLDHVLKALFTLHYTFPAGDYAGTLDHTSWVMAAPHHSIEHEAPGPGASRHAKTIYLTDGNFAGRLLALSRVGEKDRVKAVVRGGASLPRTVHYADRAECRVVVL
jgi:hypothetical protein